ncbi:unnamed protein product [Dibothriocephalus latus]|uniref:Uncharacterized protein n=1 Tax=Dibothriocephalus latus TaxID=60516 RepID=A0A3P7RBK8_DIBLA|nr:unnamed protein product [Dibothriocephalus latus]
MVRCYVRLIGNALEIWPRPADIQTALKGIVNGIESSCKGVLAWGADGRQRKLTTKTDEKEAAPEPAPDVAKDGTATVSQTCKSSFLLLSVLLCKQTLSPSFPHYDRTHMFEPKHTCFTYWAGYTISFFLSCSAYRKPVRTLV